MHDILTATLPRSLLEHKNSAYVFEICLLPEDSPWMKQAVVIFIFTLYLFSGIKYRRHGYRTQQTSSANVRDH